MASRNQKIPYVKEGTLYKFDGSVVCALGFRTGWLDWLKQESHRSFRFESAAGMTCTLVKEKRRGSSDEYHSYWYAHKRIDDKLRRRYIGKAENVTLAKLERVAMELAQLELAL
jgi:hypothetical protein